MNVSICVTPWEAYTRIHGTVHHIGGRQVSRRDAFQAVMLTAALLACTAVLEANAAL